MRLLLLCGLLLGTGLPAFATTYYVDAVQGRDANSGTSPASAWQTLAQVNRASLGAGDEVLFQRGQTWRGQLVCRSGSASGRLVYGAYGTGARPVLLGSVGLALTAGTWTATGQASVWRYGPALGQDVGNLFFDGDDTRNGIKREHAADLRQQGDFWYDPASGQLSVFSATSPAAFYTRIEAALTQDLVVLTNNQYVTVRELTLKGGAADGIMATNTAHILIESCEMAYLGGGYLFDGSRYQRYGNGVTFWAGADDGVVSRCFIHDIFDTGVSNQFFGSPAANQVNISYVNNVLQNCGLASLEIANTSGGLLRNIVFEHNTSVYAGYGWGRKDGPQRDGAVGGAKIGAHVALSGGAASNSQNSLLIRNNIFVEAYTMFVFRVSEFAAWSQMQFDYNDYYAANSAAAPALYVAYDGSAGQVSEAYTYAQFAAWETSAHQDPHSLQRDPLFASAASDYHLQAASPCIGAGSAPAAAETDFDNAPRPAGRASSLGAYEAQGATPTAPSLVSGGVYRLVARHSGKVLDVDANSSQNKGKVQQWGWNGGTNQQWVVTSQSDGSYTLTHQGTTQMLDVRQNGTADGDTIWQYSANGGPAQRWVITLTDNGYYKVLHQGTTKCLDVAGGSNATSDGVRVHQWEYLGYANQQWKFELLSQPTALRASATAAPATTPLAASVSVYPNPAHDRLLVQLPAAPAEGFQLTLLDPLGRPVRTRAPHPGAHAAELDVRGLPTGLYLLRLKQGSRVETRRVEVR